MKAACQGRFLRFRGLRLPYLITTLPFAPSSSAAVTGYARCKLY